MKNAEEESPGYRFIYVLLLDYTLGTLSLLLANAQESAEEKEKCKKEAIEICDKLASTYDQIRENYWTYRKTQIQQN